MRCVEEGKEKGGGGVGGGVGGGGEGVLKEKKIGLREWNRKSRREKKLEKGCGDYEEGRKVIRKDGEKNGKERKERNRKEEY